MDIAVVEGLKRRGIEAWPPRDAGKLGLTDEEQLGYALKNKATIFTHDDDFLSLAAESGKEHFGILYVHQQRYSVGECIRRIKAIVETRTLDDMKKRIVFI